MLRHRRTHVRTPQHMSRAGHVLVSLNLRSKNLRLKTQILTGNRRAWRWREWRQGTRSAAREIGTRVTCTMFHSSTLASGTHGAVETCEEMFGWTSPLGFIRKARLTLASVGASCFTLAGAISQKQTLASRYLLITQPTACPRAVTSCPCGSHHTKRGQPAAVDLRSKNLLCVLKLW